MPKYSVEVVFTNKKVVSVYARDEENALEEATALVEGWPNVMDVDEATVIDGDGKP
jgi:hypothetical protein